MILIKSIYLLKDDEDDFDLVRKGLFLINLKTPVYRQVQAS